MCSSTLKIWVALQALKYSQLTQPGCVALRYSQLAQPGRVVPTNVRLNLVIRDWGLGATGHATERLSELLLHLFAQKVSTHCRASTAGSTH